jgi:hypothetical protein
MRSQFLLKKKYDKVKGERSIITRGHWWQQDTSMLFYTGKEIYSYDKMSDAARE